MKIFSKPVITILIIICLAVIALAGVGYNWIWSNNVNPDFEEGYIEIPNGSNYSDVHKLLQEKNVLKDMRSFDFVASLMKYGKGEVASGRYKIHSHWNNRQLIQCLRGGLQEPINITFNNIRYPHELAGSIAKYIEPDSSDIMDVLGDTLAIQKYGYNKDNILTLFIPNTYQFYWSTTMDKFMQRMQKEHDKFWAVSWRQDSLNSLGLTTQEVYIVASIVEKETRYNPEKPTVAGVYLNRIQKGMKLEADPTVIFAVGDFTIRRVLNKHLRTVSPYNTYLNEGLPPGPICMPSISSIDGVLKAEDHDYIFFCAKPGYKGEHNFAKTLREHNNNANTYRGWLNEEKIKK